VSQIIYAVRQHTVVNEPAEAGGAEQIFIDVAGGMGQVMDYQRFVPGGRLELLDLKTGRIDNLIEDFASADVSSVDLSFDATKVVFTMRTSGDDKYHIYVSPLQRGQIIQGGNPVRAFDVDRRVFVGSGGSNAIPPATLGNVAVFGLEDGLRAYTLPGWSPRWRLTEGFPYPLAAPPLIVGTTVISLNTYGSVRAHDLNSGTRLWSQRAGDYFEEYSDDRPTALAVGEGLILVPGPRELVAMGPPENESARTPMR
jgi:outer membrane protein assembly factor BamB